MISILSGVAVISMDIGAVKLPIDLELPYKEQSIPRCTHVAMIVSMKLIGEVGVREYRNLPLNLTPFVCFLENLLETYDGEPPSILVSADALEWLSKALDQGSLESLQLLIKNELPRLMMKGEVDPFLALDVLAHIFTHVVREMRGLCEAGVCPYMSQVCPSRRVNWKSYRKNEEEVNGGENE